MGPARADGAAMRDRPILFSGEMVRAILDGRKTQTRRVIKNINHIKCEVENEDGTGSIQWYHTHNGKRLSEIGEDEFFKMCPYGKAGGKLWVRETFWSSPFGDLAYRATDPDLCVIWKPSIHMPRWASRITLEITGVRVERLQEISESEIMAEGCEIDGEDLSSTVKGIARYTWFSDIWDYINEKRGYGWNTNPWVWVVEFKKVRP